MSTIEKTAITKLYRAGTYCLTETGTKLKFTELMRALQDVKNSPHLDLFVHEGAALTKQTLEATYEKLSPIKAFFHALIIKLQSFFGLVELLGKHLVPIKQLLRDMAQGAQTVQTKAKEVLNTVVQQTKTGIETAKKTVTGVPEWLNTGLESLQAVLEAHLNPSASPAKALPPQVAPRVAEEALVPQRVVMDRPPAQVAKRPAFENEVAHLPVPAKQGAPVQAELPLPKTVPARPLPATPEVPVPSSELELPPYGKTKKNLGSGGSFQAPTSRKTALEKVDVPINRENAFSHKPIVPVQMEADRVALQNKLDSLAGEERALTEKLEALRQEESSLQAKITQGTETLEAKQQELTELSTRITKAETELQTLQAQHHTLLERITEFETREQALLTNETKLNTRETDLNDRSKALEEQAQTLGTQDSHLKGQQEQLERDQAQLKLDREAHQEEVKAVAAEKTMLADQRTEIEGLQTALAEQTKSFTTLKEEVEAAEQLLKQHQTAFEKTQTEFNQAKTDLESAQKTLLHDQNALAEAELKFAEQKSAFGMEKLELEAKTKEYQGLKAQLETDQKALLDQKAAFETAQNRFKDAEADLATKESALSETEKRLAGQEAELKELSNQLAEQVRNFGINIKDEQAQLATARAELAAHRDSHQTAVAELAREKGSLLKSRTEVEEKLGRLSTETQQYEALKNEVTNLQTQLKTDQETLAQNQKALTDAENAFETQKKLWEEAKQADQKEIQEGRDAVTKADAEFSEYKKDAHAKIKRHLQKLRAKYTAACKQQAELTEQAKALEARISQYPNLETIDTELQAAKGQLETLNLQIQENEKRIANTATQLTEEQAKIQQGLVDWENRLKEGQEKLEKGYQEFSQYTETEFEAIRERQNALNGELERLKEAKIAFEHDKMLTQTLVEAKQSSSFTLTYSHAPGKSGVLQSLSPNSNGFVSTPSKPVITVVEPEPNKAVQEVIANVTPKLPSLDALKQTVLKRAAHFDAKTQQMAERLLNAAEQVVSGRDIEALKNLSTEELVGLNLQWPHEMLQNKTPIYLFERHLPEDVAVLKAMFEQLTQNKLQLEVMNFQKIQQDLMTIFSGRSHASFAENLDLRASNLSQQVEEHLLDKNRFQNLKDYNTEALQVLRNHLDPSLKVTQQIPVTNPTQQLALPVESNQPTVSAFTLSSGPGRFPESLPPHLTMTQGSASKTLNLDQTSLNPAGNPLNPSQPLTQILPANLQPGGSAHITERFPAVNNNPIPVAAGHPPVTMQFQSGGLDPAILGNNPVDTLRDLGQPLVPGGGGIKINDPLAVVTPPEPVLNRVPTSPTYDFKVASAAYHFLENHQGAYGSAINQIAQSLMHTYVTVDAWVQGLLERNEVALSDEVKTYLEYCRFKGKKVITAQDTHQLVNYLWESNHSLRCLEPADMVEEMQAKIESRNYISKILEIQRKLLEGFTDSKGNYVKGLQDYEKEVAAFKDEPFYAELTSADKMLDFRASAKSAVEARLKSNMAPDGCDSELSKEWMIQKEQYKSLKDQLDTAHTQQVAAEIEAERQRNLQAAYGNAASTESPWETMVKNASNSTPSVPQLIANPHGNEILIATNKAMVPDVGTFAANVYSLFKEWSQINKFLPDLITKKPAAELPRAAQSLKAAGLLKEKSIGLHLDETRSALLNLEDWAELEPDAMNQKVGSWLSRLNDVLVSLSPAEKEKHLTEIFTTLRDTAIYTSVKSHRMIFYLNKVFGKNPFVKWVVEYHLAPAAVEMSQLLQKASASMIKAFPELEKSVPEAYQSVSIATPSSYDMMWRKFFSEQPDIDELNRVLAAERAMLASTDTAVSSLIEKAGLPVSSDPAATTAAPPLALDPNTNQWVRPPEAGLADATLNTQNGNTSVSPPLSPAVQNLDVKAEVGQSMNVPTGSLARMKALLHQLNKKEVKLLGAIEGLLPLSEADRGHLITMNGLNTSAAREIYQNKLASVFQQWTEKYNGYLNALQKIKQENPADLKELIQEVEKTLQERYSVLSQHFPDLQPAPPIPLPAPVVINPMAAPLEMSAEATYLKNRIQQAVPLKVNDIVDNPVVTMARTISPASSPKTVSLVTSAGKTIEGVDETILKAIESLLSSNTTSDDLFGDLAHAQATLKEAFGKKG